MKTYVLTVSRNFSKNHPRAGDTTGFVEKIDQDQKIHTIRGNYEFWKDRIENIQEGKAYLSLRYWTDRPYASKQHEFLRLHGDHVGIERLEIAEEREIMEAFSIKGKWLTASQVTDLIHNDGLDDISTLLPFITPISDKPYAIIHFTRFRYHEPEH